MGELVQSIALGFIAFAIGTEFKLSALNDRQCYFVFNNCKDIETLTYSYKIEYLDADGNVVGELDKTDTETTSGKSSADADYIRDVVKYRTADSDYESGKSWDDVDKILVTIVITSGTETLQRSATLNV